MSITRQLALLAALAFVLLSGCSTPPGPTTSIRIDFPGEADDVSATLPFDADARPAASFYSESRPHTSYTAFDQIVQWSTTSGKKLDIQTFSFGPFLAKIDSKPAVTECQGGSMSYWSLSINGKASEVGMDAATLTAGDQVEWVLTPTSC